MHCQTYIVLYALILFLFLGQLSHPDHGDTFVVLPNSDVEITWNLGNINIKDLTFRQWFLLPSTLLAQIVFNGRVNTDRTPPNLVSKTEIKKPSTLILKNVDSSLNGIYQLSIWIGNVKNSSDVTVFVAGK